MICERIETMPFTALQTNTHDSCIRCKKLKQFTEETIIELYQMNKGRRRGIALPPGLSFSVTQSDFSNGNLYSTPKHNETYIEQNKAEQTPAKEFDEISRTRSILRRERRGSACSTSVTLPLGPERRRKYSFQIGRVTSSKIQGLVQEDDIENHFTVILGSPAVGKTALVVRYITGRFVHEYDPTLEMIYEKVQELGNVKGILRIMDTAGSIESCTAHIRKAEGIIVVYSITDRYSFEQAKNYLRTIKESQRFDSPFDYELPTILVGNKRELRRGREVSRSEGRETAKEFGCLFIESSAAHDRNVQKIFTNLFLQIHRIKAERQTAIANNARSFVSSFRNFFQSKKK